MRFQDFVPRRYAVPRPILNSPPSTGMKGTTSVTLVVCEPVCVFMSINSIACLRRESPPAYSVGFAASVITHRLWSASISRRARTHPHAVITPTSVPLRRISPSEKIRTHSISRFICFVFLSLSGGNSWAEIFSFRPAPYWSWRRFAGPMGLSALGGASRKLRAERP